MPTEIALGTGTAIPDAGVAERRRRSEHRAMVRFTSLLGFIRAWIAANDRAVKVYITPEEGVVHLRVVARAVPYDFELRRSLTDLVIKLNRGGYEVLGSVIPDGTADELAAYLDPEQALVLLRQ